ncbi:hypothetical protein F1904_13040 [Akkermansia muciniphila]|uniref:hypothetical protein n=1 Tax=Akkermansia muciniphila TaxID=239935 RepID=UPI00122F1B62|nr:hypothetical protein F1904_13040 [Akkermansia muciniphila]
MAIICMKGSKHGLWGCFSSIRWPTQMLQPVRAKVFRRFATKKQKNRCMACHAPVFTQCKKGLCHPSKSGLQESEHAQKAFAVHMHMLRKLHIIMLFCLLFAMVL